MSSGDWSAWVENAVSRECEQCPELPPCLPCSLETPPPSQAPPGCWPGFGVLGVHPVFHRWLNFPQMLLKKPSKQTRRRFPPDLQRLCSQTSSGLAPERAEWRLLASREHSSLGWPPSCQSLRPGVHPPSPFHFYLWFVNAVLF